MTNLEKKIEELVEPEVEKLGLELYDVEFVKEGKEYYLRIKSYKCIERYFR